MMMHSRNLLPKCHFFRDGANIDVDRAEMEKSQFPITHWVPGSSHFRYSLEYHFTQHNEFLFLYASLQWVCCHWKPNLSWVIQCTQFIAKKIQMLRGKVVCLRLSSTEQSLRPNRNLYLNSDFPVFPSNGFCTSSLI